MSFNRQEHCERIGQATRFPSFTPEQAKAAFWSKVDVKGPDECWLWKGASGGRYGQAYLPNHRKAGAHRLAFFWMFRAAMSTKGMRTRVMTTRVAG